MTDGIIQEVFSKIGKEYILPLTRDDIDFLQQELIEKIKQEFMSNEGFVMSSTMILETLIGDNE